MKGSPAVFFVYCWLLLVSLFMTRWRVETGGRDADAARARPAGHRLQRRRRAAQHLAPMDVTADESHETSSPTVTES